MSDYLPLAALVVFMAASCYLGYAANQAMKGESFLKGYFLGGRGLGPWAMALTATVQSGGTFVGYPSFAYTYGWIVALWIASYMVVPLCSFGVLGKRIGQLARRTGAVTVPDLLAARFGSVALGRAASLIIVIFLAVNMISQFKGGAVILKTVMAGSSAIALTEESGPASAAVGSVDRGYLLGLAVFTVVVVGYTVYGGFLAAVWTDVFQSVMMLVGVMILLPLALMKAGGLAAATQAGIEQVGPEFAYGPGSGDWHPLGRAFSYFFVWTMASIGSAPTLVRHMAFRDTKTIRQAQLLLATYNVMIYLPLLLVAICARAILPDLVASGKSDEMIARLSVSVAHPVIAGLILTAPFGAVMATVSSYLIMIGSGLTRDLYQRWLFPNASEQTIKRVSYLTMVTIALIVAFAAIHPPQFLQDLIVYSGTSVAAAFMVPALMTAFWPRATAVGSLAAMVGGPLTMFVLYAYNLFDPVKPGFRAYALCGLDPFVWGLAVAGALGFVVSWLSPPPRRELVGQFFQP